MSSTPAGPICHAPWTAWHFDPYGWVTACTANKRDPLGNVATHTLRQIWEGSAAETFRRRFDGGGLAHGCDLCAWQREQSGPDAMYARLYDHVEISPRASGPVHLEFALSTTCNLQCVMCNGSHSSSIRARREGLDPVRSPYHDGFFDQLADLLPDVRTTKFLGGEPFLATENFRTWALMADVGGGASCHVTTNGTVWNDRVEAALDRLPMSFAVSIDGATAETVERVRAGASFDQIWTNVDRLAEHVTAHGTGLSLTYCLMTMNWHELLPFLALADERGLPVFVNTVITPFRYSLYDLPRSDLAEIVAQLDARTPEAERILGPNLEIWHEQLGRLHDSLRQAPTGSEAPVHLPSLATAPVPSTDPIPTIDEATEQLSAWAGRRCADLSIDATSRIVAVDVGEQVQPHYDRMIGLGHDELFVWLQSAFGRPDRADHLIQAEHHGERHLWFCQSDVTTEVRVVGLSTDDGGGRWLVAARQLEPEPALGVTRISLG